MSLSGIRTYLKTRINTVDSDFKEHKDAFNDENIGRSKFNKAYHITYGGLDSGELKDLITDDIMNMTVKLFFKGFRDTQNALDDAMDKANTIRLDIVNRTNYVNQTNIKNVYLSNMTPESLDSNDNHIVITLNFIVRLAYCP